MIKNSIKKLIGKTGYEIKRVKKKIVEVIPEEITIQISGFTVKVNSNNPLSYWYKKYPQYNSELKRVSKLIISKYPQLGVIDIGANIGDTLCILKSAVTAKFICIEGDPVVFKLLADNVSQFNDVTVLNYFMGERTELIETGYEKDGWNSTLVPAEDNNKKTVHLHSLDDVLSDFEDIKDYKLLKIDTEGYDTKILRGSFNFLKKTMPVIFLEYNRDNMERIGEKGIDVLDMLREIGYSIVLVYEGMGRFILSASLNDTKMIRQLHGYIDGKKSAIYYFDLCVFHSSDEDIASAFIENEEKFRLNEKNS